MGGSGQQKSIRKYIKAAASPSVVFFTLPWLMAILVMGTLAQKYLGLYEAQKSFFSGWVLWLGPVPLPGSYLTIGAISLALLAKFLLYSPWKKHQAGIIITHLGVLVLLIGGIVTAVTQKEGFVMIGEGGTVSSVSDYYDRVLSIEKNDAPYATLDFSKINEGGDLKDAAHLPFSAMITLKCDNCQPVMQEDVPKNARGFATKVTLKKVPAEKTPEANLSGVIMSIEDISAEQDGLYVAVEEIPRFPTVTYHGDEYRFFMGRRQTPLPFSVTLDQFERTMHPGTDMARGFSSRLLVSDGDVEWPYTIRMNEPLRYKGYTFYQSSFTIRPDGEYTILSVVQNKGRVIPYVASVLIFIGIALHLFLRLTKARTA